MRQYMADTKIINKPKGRRRNEMFNSLTEMAIYIVGGYSYGYYEDYAQLQHQLNYELNYGVFKETEAEL